MASKFAIYFVNFLGKNIKLCDEIFTENTWPKAVINLSLTFYLVETIPIIDPNIKS